MSNFKPASAMSERGGNAWTLHVAIMQDNTSEILGKLLDLKALAGRNPRRIFSQD